MQFRFSLIDYTINPAGVTTVLSDEPVGWDTLGITIKRDENTHGMLFEYSLNKLGFHGEAYGIINTAYIAKGAEAYTNLLIEVKCSDTDAFEEVYTGRLVYARISFEEKDYCLVSIPLEQTSCVQQFRSRIDAKVDLTSTNKFSQAPDAVGELDAYDGLGKEVSLLGKPIYFVDEGETPPGQVFGPYEYLSTIPIVSWQPPLDVLKEDFNSMFAFEADGTTPASIYASIAPGTIEILEELADVCTLDDEIIFRIDYDIDIDVVITNPTLAASDITYRISLFHTDSGGVFKAQYDCLSTFTHNHNGATKHGDLIGLEEHPFGSLAQGDRIFVIIWSDYTDTGALFEAEVTITINKLLLRASVETRCDETPAKLFLVNEALSRTAEIVSDDCLRVFSNYFGRQDAQPYPSDADGCGSLEAITNGLFLRRATKMDGTEPDCFVSFKTLFDSLNAIHNIGMTLEDDPNRAGFLMLRVEPVQYFYKSNILLTLDEVKEIERNFVPKRAIALFNIGYKKWESEYTGGQDEINTKREYRTELTQVETKMTQLSDFIASTYGIEITRRQGPTTEDYKYDNELFIICLERSYGGYSPEVFEDLQTENVLSPDNLYNVRISPYRNLLRWFKSLRTIFSNRFKFNAGEGNYIAEVGRSGADACLLELEGSMPAENDNVTLNTFESVPENYTPLWRPETIEFKYPLSYAQFKVIKADPTATIRITQGSKTYDGFIEDMTYTPAEGMAKFKLLRAWS